MIWDFPPYILFTSASSNAPRTLENGTSQEEQRSSSDLGLQQLISKPHEGSFFASSVRTKMRRETSASPPSPLGFWDCLRHSRHSSGVQRLRPTICLVP